VAVSLHADPAVAGGNRYPKYTTSQTRRGLAVLARLAQPHLIVSVALRAAPARPERGVRSLLVCPRHRAGHLQHWSARGFLVLLDNVMEVRKVRPPWTMALCRRR
jgi:hypothetical protein